MSRVNRPPPVFMALAAFVFFYFASQAMALSLLSIWLTRTLGLSGVEAGTIFSANFFGAMCAQPIYGYISDRMGLRKNVPAAIAVLVGLSGPFFTYVYAPLLQTHLVVGAVVGGAYLGVTFIAGSYAIESFIDRVGRRFGFEYSRVRLWGSLGYAAAAAFSGDLFNLDPTINFFVASAAGLIMLPLLLVAPVRGVSAEPTAPSGVTVRDSLAVLRLPKFWRFMVLILGVTNLYLVYDQQFAFYFSTLFATPEEGSRMFGYLNSTQIFLEAGGLFVAPVIVKRIGATRGLMLATAIMIVRITGSAFAIGPITISLCKLAHSVELPILLVSVFRFIAYHFDNKVASTVYMVGFSFGHSLGLAVLSPIAGLGYDRFGFQNTYLLIAVFALVFWIAALFALPPTPAENALAKASDIPEPVKAQAVES